MRTTSSNIQVNDPVINWMQTRTNTVNRLLYMAMKWWGKQQLLLLQLMLNPQRKVFEDYWRRKFLHQDALIKILCLIFKQECQRTERVQSTEWRLRTAFF